MRVELVELRAGAIKLTKQEIADAPRHVGNLFITAGDAHLTTGDNPSLGQLVRPLVDCEVYKLRGDVMMIRGRQAVAQWKDEYLPQVWACRVVSGTPE